MPSAARVGDNHLCTMLDPATGAPHVGGPVLPYPNPSVFVNAVPQARATDKLVCSNPAPDFIVTGSATVLINGLPAARLTDKTLHGAPASTVVCGSANVEIGGPTIGVTLGDLDPRSGAIVRAWKTSARELGILDPTQKIAGTSARANAAWESVLDDRDHLLAMSSRIWSAFANRVPPRDATLRSKLITYWTLFQQTTAPEEAPFYLQAAPAFFNWVRAAQ